MDFSWSRCQACSSPQAGDAVSQANREGFSRVQGGAPDRLKKASGRFLPCLMTSTTVLWTRRQPKSYVVVENDANAWSHGLSMPIAGSCRNPLSIVMLSCYNMRVCCTCHVPPPPRTRSQYVFQHVPADGSYILLASQSQDDARFSGTFVSHVRVPNGPGCDWEIQPRSRLVWYRSRLRLDHRDSDIASGWPTSSALSALAI